MSEDGFSKHRVSHLFLPVGGNPLPNIVSGLLLSSPGGTISLICSSETEGVACTVEHFLGKRLGKSRVIDRERVHESDSRSIAKGISEQLRKHGRESVDSLGLNYTGGTKAMAVHAYRTIERWAKGDGGIRPPVSMQCSYLDARELVFVFDPDDPLGVARGETKSVGLEIKLSLDELLFLHDWRVLGEHPIRTKPLMLAPALELARINADPKRYLDKQTWLEWKKGNIDPILEKKKIGKPTPSPSEAVLTFPASGGRVFAELERELNLVSGHAFEVSIASQTVNISPRAFCTWLGGGWLESVVLDALMKIKERFHLHDLCMNLEPSRADREKPQFEFDVAAMRGYQLFGFSCSTDADHARLKLKLFECVTRVRQLGGDEACAALVCCSPRPEWLEDEIRSLIGSGVRIKVFGNRDLEHLADRFSDWIKTQIGRTHP